MKGRKVVLIDYTFLPLISLMMMIITMMIIIIIIIYFFFLLAL